MPIMQWHSDPVCNGRCDFTGAWQNNDRSPWNMAAYHEDKRLLTLLREQFRLHYNLMPYLYALMLESHESGVAPMRHLITEFQGDGNVLDTETEFMLGDALLVAPILDGYLKSREVYLPEGKWYGLFDGKEVVGGRKISVGLSRRNIPVFMRDNSCVPLNLVGGKLCSDVGNRTDGYSELTFLVSGAGEYRFRDDLGNDIVLKWDESGHSAKENALKTEFKVIHAAGAKLYK